LNSPGDAALWRIGPNWSRDHQKNRLCHVSGNKSAEHTMPNPFVHIELASSDVQKAKSFYGSLFDWKLVDRDMGDMTYTMVDVGQGTGGGMMQHPMPGTPSAWIPYAQVENVRAATEKAKSLGAKIIRDVADIPNAGSFSIIQDPTGAVIGLWQNKPA
jgi:hypothetical protein